ncbi:DUF2666 domain-containing protein [Candidatus Micrarchaeota archaeon]|nr:DUF2666 domain-containing protein [Candidatus Micrarchaeota archaeon]
MIGRDEVIFAGQYRDLKIGINYDLSNRKPEDVAAVLSRISSEIEPHSYLLSGIDTGAIDAFAKPEGRGIPAVCRFLDKNSTAWNRLLKQMLKEPKLKPAADSYLFNRLLTNAEVEFKFREMPSWKPEEENTGDQIAFIGKYKDWVAIKKLSVDKARDYEVSAILGNINYSAVNKAFDFSGIERDDVEVKRVTKGKRKSIGNASEALKSLQKENPYIVCKVLEEVGYRPYASPHMLTDAHPDIKPPKARGRKPRG